jgi:hypothetical protein
MLETIDLLVGLAVVMLVVSFAVTMITQLIVSLLNLRGIALWRGLSNLLCLLDSGVHPKQAQAIASAVLKDPLVAQSILPFLPRGWAQVVHREELTKLLLGFALEPEGRGHHEPGGVPPSGPQDPRLLPLRATMRKSLKSNEIDDPAATLKAVRMAVLDLESAHPELSNSERANIAILNFADSDFIGKLYAWFDQTVDRVSDTFTGWSRVTAVFVAIAVAIGLQLDTIGLIDHLSTDRAVRTKLVNWAIDNAPKLSPPGAATNAVTPANSAAPSAAPAAATPNVDANNAVVAAARDALLNEKLIVLPTSIQVWTQRWNGPVTCADVARAAPMSAPADAFIGDPCPLPRVSWLGVALSAVLLSLGGPFWYEALKNLLKLRSLVASKDDDQRQDRQTNTTAAGVATAGAGGPAAPRQASFGGEAGDLKAQG